MDYVKPIEVTKNMVEVAAAKASLSVSDLLIRGFLSGALLGFATSLYSDRPGTPGGSPILTSHSALPAFAVQATQALSVRICGQADRHGAQNEARPLIKRLV